MEIKNSSENSSRVNRATLFYGIPGVVLLALGGLPLLGRVWARLTTFGLLFPSTPEVLSAVAGVALVSVAVVIHRRTRRAERAAAAK